MTRSLVKLSLRKRFIYNNLNASDIRLAINFLKLIKRAKKPNASKSVLIIKRWD
jgi:hypothetical protein